MLETVLEIIISHPGNYSQILQSKKYKIVYDWIMQNSLATTDHLPTHIYSAVHQVSNICKNKYARKVKSFNDGFRFCGHSSSCACNRENQKSKNLVPTDERIEKTKKTNQIRYNSDSPFGSLNVQEKSRSTMLERHGVENYAKSELFKEKAMQTSLKKYGVVHFSKMHISEYALDILDHKQNFIEAITGKTPTQLANELNVDLTTVVVRINQFDCQDLILQRSTLEADMKDFLDAIQVNYIQNSRSIIKPYELDFYLPDHNIAIEMNGDYWHSDLFKPRKYHQGKWESCQEQNIQLIQIRETDWNNNPDKFKSMLKFQLNVNDNIVIGARKFTIQLVSSNIATSFLNKYHLQGHTSSLKHYGAFNSLNQLKAVMSFGWTRGSLDARRFELKRWVTDSYASYPGLFSKTFKYAQKDFGFDFVVSFSMNDWFTGNVYKQSGFIQKKQQNPAYQYLYEKKWRHCSYFTKDNIRKRFTHIPEVAEMLDAGKTEFYVMNYLNILRIWDSGKTEWIWQKSDS